MSVRRICSPATRAGQLLLLSLVSGVLGLGGAALGVGLSLGPVPLTPWVFGVTAGVFLYVALVDMVRGGMNWEARIEIVTHTPPRVK